MANLGDFIGSLLREITIARVHADIEALKLSDVYKKGGLMEGMPIPRFRLPEVSIDVPVFVEDEVKETKVIYSELLQLPKLDVIKNAIAESAKESSIKLTNKDKSSISRKLKSSFDLKWTKPKDVQSALNVFSEVIEEVSKELSSYLNGQSKKTIKNIPTKNMAFSASQVAQFKLSLTKYFKSYLIEQIANDVRLKVQTKTANLKELDDSSYLTRITLTIKEDGLEAIQIKQDDGVIEEKIVPE